MAAYQAFCVAVNLFWRHSCDVKVRCKPHAMLAVAAAAWQACIVSRRPVSAVDVDRSAEMLPDCLQKLYQRLTDKYRPAPVAASELFHSEMVAELPFCLCSGVVYSHVVHFRVPFSLFPPWGLWGFYLLLLLITIHISLIITHNHVTYSLCNYIIFLSLLCNFLLFLSIN